MEKYQINKIMKTITIAALSLILPMYSMGVAAVDGNENEKYRQLEEVGNYDELNYHWHEWNRRTKVIRGVIATGFNDTLGKTAFDLGEPFGVFGFTSFGIYNPNGSQPIPLDENSVDSDLLATSVHPNFLFLAGKTRDDVDPEWENQLLRDVLVNTGFSLEKRKPLRGVLDGEPLELAQAEPANNITLGQWLRGSGFAVIRCRGSDRATINIKVRNLIPNRMYGIWATIGGDFLSSFPIGGTPNMFVTNRRGNGTIKRTVNFCPLDIDSADRPLLMINTVLYSNHQNYGAVTEPSDLNGYWFGLVTHNHIQFPVNVEPVDH